MAKKKTPRTPVPDYMKANRKLPNLNPNKAPVTSAGKSAAQMADASPQERKATIRKQRGRSKPAQTTDTRTMAERRFAAEGSGTTVEKAPTTLSKWQKSVQTSPGRGKKKWKSGTKASGKKVKATTRSDSKAEKSTKVSRVITGGRVRATTAQKSRKAKGTQRKNSGRKR